MQAFAQLCQEKADISSVPEKLGIPTDVINKPPVNKVVPDAVKDVINEPFVNNVAPARPPNERRTDGGNLDQPHVPDFLRKAIPPHDEQRRQSDPVNRSSDVGKPLPPSC
jgi:hypothetical protein